MKFFVEILLLVFVLCLIQYATPLTFQQASNLDLSKKTNTIEERRKETSDSIFSKEKINHYTETRQLPPTQSSHKKVIFQRNPFVEETFQLENKSGKSGKERIAKGKRLLRFLLF